MFVRRNRRPIERRLQFGERVSQQELRVDRQLFHLVRADGG